MLPQDKNKWLQILGWSVLVMIVTLLPYLYGLVNTPADSFFSGVHSVNAGDTYSYLAWMQQAREGNWLFKVLFTSEAQPRVVFQPLFLLMGGAASITGFSNIAIFHLSRFLLGIIFLLVVYQFLGLFFSAEKRKTAWWLVAVGSGLGWLWGSYIQGIDLWMVDAVTFLNLYESPLNILALTLIVLIFYYLIQYFTVANKKKLIYAGLSFFWLSIIHPYDFLTVTMIFVFWQLLLFFQNDFKGKSKSIFLVFLAGLAGAIISFASLLQNPALRSWLDANILPSPPVLSYLVGYGLLIPLALFSFKVIKLSEDKKSLLIAWLIASLLLVFQPFFHFQRKLALGLHLPLAILAAYGLCWLVSRFKLPKKFVIVVIAVLALSNIKLIILDTYVFDSQLPPYYWPQDYLEAINFLADQEKGVVLTHPGIANFVPGISGQTVYHGHGDQTIEGERKEEEFAWLISDQGSLADKMDWLASSQINYVLYLPDLADQDYLVTNYQDIGLELIYSNDSALVLTYNL